MKVHYLDKSAPPVSAEAAQYAVLMLKAHGWTPFSLSALTTEASYSTFYTTVSSQEKSGKSQYCPWGLLPD